MILFVLEGNHREPFLYNAIQRLYFPKDNETILCSFGNNIYNMTISNSLIMKIIYKIKLIYKMDFLSNPFILF
jgi:hypothetical protein